MPASCRFSFITPAATVCLASALLLSACASTQPPVPMVPAQAEGRAATHLGGRSPAMAASYQQMVTRLRGSGASVNRDADDRIRVVLPGDLAYEAGRPALKPQGRGWLDGIAAALRSLPQAEIRITGHTDARGSAAANQALSQDRAESARDWLVARGVGAMRFSVIGRGALDPVAGNADEPGRAANRRVELLIADRKGRAGG